MRMYLLEYVHQVLLIFNSGLIKNSNTQCLIGMSLKNDIENGLDHEIIMENDANCFALAESLLGSAKGYDVVFGVINGNRCWRWDCN